MRLIYLLVGLLPLALASPLISRETDLPNPGNDSFYQAPANLNTFQLGDIIRQRQVETNVKSSHLESAHQVLYATQNTQMEDDATVATIFLPKEPSSPPKVLSLQTYQDSASFECTASYSFLKDTPSAGVATTVLDTAVYINWALSKGFYVVVPDNEGRRAIWLAGFENGIKTLDGVRAINNFANLSNPQIAFYGYSGGAHATVWATDLSSTYAPELNVVGSASGGTPLDSRGTLEFFDGGPSAGFAGVQLLGLSRAYPELGSFFDQHVTEKGQAAFDKLSQPGFCIGTAFLSFPFKKFSSFFNVSKPYDEPVFQKVLKRETLLKSVSSDPTSISVPTFPRYMFHGTIDELVPFKDSKRYVVEQCAEGANILFQPYLLVEHIGGLLLGIVPVISFLNSAFEGKAPSVKCGHSLPTLPSLFDPEAKELIGEDTVKMLISLNNTKSPFGGTIHF